MSDSQTPNPEQNRSTEPVVPPAIPQTRRERAAQASADVTPPTPTAEPGEQSPAAEAPAPAEQPAAPVAPAPEAPTAPEIPVVTEAEFPPAREPIPAPESLDEGTYDQIREPRRQGLQLDGTWHQISPKYVAMNLIQLGAWILLVAAAAIVFHVLSGQWWGWLIAAALVVVSVIEMIILPRQARALGYMLRGDDIVFRKGILWQRVVAVPYGRMQLIDITHGPMDRGFGVAKLKMVTAAASTGVEIPGLSQQAAEDLRDALIEVAETRRTGL